MKNKLKEFNQTIHSIDKEYIIKDIINECEKGLKNNKFIDDENNVCALPMFPTYINPECINDDVSKDIICMDLGGTNFRIALVNNDIGVLNIKRVDIFKTPGLLKELSKDEYFFKIAICLKDYIDYSDSISLCFSYGLQMNDKLDGKLLKWSKEVKAKEVEGEYIAYNLEKMINKLYNKKVTVKILNDTSATLLSTFILNKWKPNFSYLGIIYGTGLNICYIEEAKRIEKIEELDESIKHMIINTEIANYKGFSLGKYDEMVLDETNDKSLGRCEKLCSGGYLPKIIYYASLDLLDDFNISKDECTLIEVSRLLKNKNNVFDRLSDSDKEKLKEICVCLIDRASLILALLTSAILIKLENKVSLISVEGTTFYKLYGFKESYIRYLDELLDKYGISYELLDGRDKNLLASAIL